MRIYRYLCVKAVAFILVASGTNLLWSQVAGGRFTGVVRDQSGAVIPGAKVSIRNVATGVEASYITTGEGIYAAPSLIPGSYILVAMKDGFRQEKIGPVLLQVNQTVPVNFALTVGSTKQTVSVTASGAQLVETETSEISQVIGSREVSQLPLNGRNWTQLVFLSGAAEPGSPGEGGNGPINFSGQRAHGNMYMIDGMPNMEEGSHMVWQFIPVDAIQEFSVQENSFSAEYGNATGGVMNISIKSGTNRLHGSLFEYLRNDKFDAANFFTNAVNGKKAPYRFNQFGGSVGGPIKRDKVFFFGDYQGTISRTGVPTIATVPISAERTGDFSGYRDASGNLIPIYDPTSGYPVRTQFSYNVIPPDKINPVAAKFMAAMPLPNLFSSPGVPLAFNNYATELSATNDVHNFDVRTDFNLSQRSTLFARYSFENNDYYNPSVFGAPLSGCLVFCGPLYERYMNGAIGHTFTLRPNLVNEFMFGFNRTRLLILQVNYGKELSKQFGIPGVNTGDPNLSGLPLIDVSGLFTVGDPLAGPIKTWDTNYNLFDNMSWVVGRHAIRFGVNYMRDQDNVFAVTYPRGFFVFEPTMTGSLTDFLTTGNFHGNALASFLTGYPTVTIQDKLLSPFGIRFPSFGSYFQDNFKATSRLTLNLGVRYDIMPAVHEAFNRESNFDPITKTMLIAGKDMPSAARHTDFRDLAPRVGLAYSLTSDQKTALRMGYAMAYQNVLNNPSPGGYLTYNPPFYGVNTITQTPIFVPTRSISDGLPPVPIPPANAPTGNVRYENPLDRNSRSQTWNVDIQRALSSNILFQVSYLGSAGTRLSIPININQAPPGLGDIASRRPYGAQFGTISAWRGVGNSIYHALEIKAEKRASRGLYFLSSYTFSKAIDDQSTGQESTAATPTGPQNPNNLGAERGLASFDRRNYFVFSTVWEIPFGRGRHFGTDVGKPWNWSLGGWQIGAIYTAVSGSPMSAEMACSDINGEGTCRPNLVGNPNLPKSQRTIAKWFDTGAFAIPTAFTYGTAGRDIIQTPGSSNLDIGLDKSFQWGKDAAKKIQFRAEFFNTFNNTHLGLPNNSIDSPGFGSITSAGSPRLIQLALRLEF